MIQPSWDNLAESTQRNVNRPSKSQQLQEAYNAGYYRALNEMSLGGGSPIGPVAAGTDPDDDPPSGPYNPSPGLKPPDGFDGPTRYRPRGNHWEKQWQDENGNWHWYPEGEGIVS